MFNKRIKKRRDKDLSVVKKTDTSLLKAKERHLRSTSSFIKMSLIYYLLRYLFLEAIITLYDSDVC